ncbi:MAG: hypothetical protein PHF60_00560 [Candidatus ainarchaeum sp.]|nr:hypothetical protein [Candidatus ainarchaeum sp.]
MANPDRKAQQDGWNNLKAQFAALKAPPEGIQQLTPEGTYR